MTYFSRLSYFDTIAVYVFETSGCLPHNACRVCGWLKDVGCEGHPTPWLAYGRIRKLRVHTRLAELSVVRLWGGLSFQ